MQQTTRLNSKSFATERPKCLNINWHGLPLLHTWPKTNIELVVAEEITLGLVLGEDMKASTGARNIDSEDSGEGQAVVPVKLIVRAHSIVSTVGIIA